MTPRPFVLPPDLPVARALELARDRKIHHLLVQGDDGIVGVVCLCDILEREPLDAARAPRGRVADFLSHRTIVVGPTDTVDAASALMVREGVGCLPVVKNGEIVGVLTRADLCQTGEFEAGLDARCASCGTREDVRHALGSTVGFCPACWESTLSVRDEELGSGD